MTIAEQIYNYIVTVLFGEIPNNSWYTNNLDTIRGIAIIVIAVIILAVALYILVLVCRFIANLVRLK